MIVNGTTEKNIVVPTVGSFTKWDGSQRLPIIMLKNMEKGTYHYRLLMSDRETEKINSFPWMIQIQDNASAIVINDPSTLSTKVENNNKEFIGEGDVIIGEDGHFYMAAYFGEDKSSEPAKYKRISPFCIIELIKKEN